MVLNFQYSGSWQDGFFKVSALEELLDSGEEDLSTNLVLHNIGADLIFPYVSITGGIYGMLPTGGISVTTPDFIGFSLKGSIKRELLTNQGIDLFKDYYSGFSLYNDSMSGGLNWHDDFLSIEGSFSYNKPRITNSLNTAAQISFQLEGNSIFDFSARAAISLPDDWEIKANCSHVQYMLLPTASTETMRILKIYDSDASYEMIKLNQRNISLSVINNNFSASLFYHDISLPELTGNTAWIESTPLSPAGIFYRRRDLLTGFSGSAALFGAVIDGETRTDNFIFNWNISAGRLQWLLNGSSYYMDGMATLPFLVWDMKKHQEVIISEKGGVFYIYPEFSIALIAEYFSISLLIKQFVPLFPKSTYVEFESEASLWGGTGAGIFITINPDEIEK